MSYREPLTQQQIRSMRSEIDALTDAFDALSDHVVITDQDSHIIYANKAAEKHTGYSFSEMAGKTPGELWGGQMPKEFYEKMWEQIKRFKVPYVGEVENKNKDGYQYWQELRIYPIFDDNSEIKFFIGMEPDITVRKAYDMVRDTYVKELERLMKFMEGREVKIKELTEEVQKLKERLRSQP